MSSPLFLSNQKQDVSETVHEENPSCAATTTPDLVHADEFRALDEKIILKIYELEKRFDEKLFELEESMRKNLPQNIVYTWWMKFVQHVIDIIIGD
jgi:hypothetical protein